MAIFKRTDNRERHQPTEKDSKQLITEMGNKNMSFSAVEQCFVKPIVRFVLNFQTQAAKDVNFQSQLIDWRIGVQ